VWSIDRDRELSLSLSLSLRWTTKPLEDFT
jgi:hypothetical protein